MRKTIYLVALAGALTMGCAGEATAPEALKWIPPVDLHLEDGYIALMFDGTLVDVWAGGQVLGSGPLVIATEASTAVTASFHDAAGNRLMQGFEHYQVTLTPLDAKLLKFTRTGPFAGTLVRIAPGPTELTVALYNLDTQTVDFGPFAVPVRAQ
jgi:hypothetical protein